MNQQLNLSLFLAMFCLFSLTKAKECNEIDICYATQQDIVNQFQGIKLQQPACKCDVDARSLCDVLKRPGPNSPKHLCNLTMSTVFKNISMDPRLPQFRCDNCTMTNNLCDKVGQCNKAKIVSISHLTYIITKTTATPSLATQSISPSFSYRISMTINDTIAPSTSYVTSSLPTSSIHNGASKDGKVKKVLLYFAVVVTVVLIIA